MVDAVARQVPEGARTASPAPADLDDVGHAVRLRVGGAPVARQDGFGDAGVLGGELMRARPGLGYTVRVRRQVEQRLAIAAEAGGGAGIGDWW